MLKAKLDSIRKNKKGFSLVELIIVVAIMVALIAVLAPSYVKYLQRSRDAALQTACEEYVTALKTALADPDTTLTAAQIKPTTQVNITLSAATTGGLSIQGDSAYSTAIDYTNDTSKKLKSDLTFYVSITTKGTVVGPTTVNPGSSETPAED